MEKYNYIPQSVYEIMGGTKKNGRSYFNKKLSVHLKRTDSNGNMEDVKNQLFVVDPKSFVRYKEKIKKENRSVSVIGKTRLKPINDKDLLSNKYDAILHIEKSNRAVGEFEVCSEYKLSKIIGYIPIGEDRFIAVAKFNPLFPIIAILLLLSLIALLLVMIPRKEVVLPNRYLEENDVGIVNSSQTETRYRMNTTMTVVKGTIQDLNFENVNEGKSLRIKIKKDYKNDVDYVYDSGLVPFGKKVTADTLLKSVEPGTYKTIAEVFVYDENEEQVGQTNFEIKLIVK